MYNEKTFLSAVKYMTHQGWYVRHTNWDNRRHEDVLLPRTTGMGAYKWISYRHLSCCTK